MNDMTQNDNENYECTLGDPERVLEKGGPNVRNGCTVFLPRKVMGDRCCLNCEHCENSRK